MKEEASCQMKKKQRVTMQSHHLGGHSRILKTSQAKEDINCSDDDSMAGVAAVSPKQKSESKRSIISVNKVMMRIKCTKLLLLRTIHICVVNLCVKVCLD